MAGQQRKVSILDFFSSTKPIEKIAVKRGQTDGRSLPINDYTRRTPLQSKRNTGLAYVEEFKKQMEVEENSNEAGQPSNSVRDIEAPPVSHEISMVGVEDLSTIGGTRVPYEADDEQYTNVYTKYDFTPVQPKGLVIEGTKDKILAMVDSNQVVVIEGATGCGKSTQVPQYILDLHASRNLPCNIVVTQPRRIAATSIAKWICQERNWELGSVVGYQIGLDFKRGPDTRLLFCTTGVLLEKLISSKDMNQFTHIILDEVHERNQDMDFLMILVRKLLRSNSKNVKVILMSATFDTKRFAEYFSLPINNTLVGAPIVEVKLLNQKYKISEYYLDDLRKLGSLPNIDGNDPCVNHEGITICKKLLDAFDKIDLKEFQNDNGHLPDENTEHYRHCVLVFLPGLRNIEEVFESLEGEEQSYKLLLIPLHSSLTRDEQQRVFERARIGYRKVVLCTDIAESSVTVPDVKYVIDFCLTKELIADPLTNFTSLKLRWASRTNCKQRAGRTGRVMNGRVYRLVPKSFYFDTMSSDKEPEMLRCPLEITVLKCKLLEIGEPRAVLSLALDPPDVSNIERAILLLKETGALLSTVGGRQKRFDGDITFVGRVMATLPVEIQVSKLIVLGYLFSLLEETIIIGAMLSAQNVFTTPFKDQISAYNSKLRWADGSCSDPVAYLNAFTVWQHCVKSGYFRSEARDEKRYCGRYFLNPKGLREANELVAEITSRLKDKNIFVDDSDLAARWSKQEIPFVLKTLIAGAFYPNYFVRGAQGGQVDERDAAKKVGGHDVRRSIYLTGMNPEQPGLLYAKSIKNQLEQCRSQMKVYYDSSKYIVEFGRFEDELVAAADDSRRNRAAGRNSNLSDNQQFQSAIPGGISMAVYRAIKLRTSHINIKIDILGIAEANRLAAEYGIRDESLNFRYLEQRPREATNIPGIGVTDIEFTVCEVANPGRFWIHLVLHKASIDRLRSCLVESNLRPLDRELRAGDIVAAPYEDGTYYRAKIVNLESNGVTAKVEFMDYGNSEFVPIRGLKNVQGIPEALWRSPPFAIECRLAGIAPSCLKNKNTFWSEEATRLFGRYCTGLMRGKIFSCVDDVMALTVNKMGEESDDINSILLRDGFAYECVEDYRSRTNNQLRLKAQESSGSEIRDEPTYSTAPLEVEPPPASSCYSYVVLKGPYSPLEMKVYGVTRSTISREIRLDPQSVNSVLLDSNPEDVHERMLVGAVITQPNEDRNYLTVRNTTLMPNIHGLPPLMALLFAPCVELRTNLAETKYIGILCGLGFDDQGVPHFPENDLTMTFDCVIDDDDLTLVNHIRTWMSALLKTDEGESLPSIALGDKRDGQIRLKEYLLKLLMKRRESQELSFDKSNFDWGKVNEDRAEDMIQNDSRHIFKLIRRHKLTTHDELLENAQNLCEALNNPADTPIDMPCKLCNVRLSSVRDIGVHINLRSHREREEEEYGQEE